MYPVEEKIEAIRKDINIHARPTPTAEETIAFLLRMYDEALAVNVGLISENTSLQRKLQERQLSAKEPLHSMEDLAIPDLTDEEAEGFLKALGILTKLEQRLDRVRKKGEG